MKKLKNILTSVLGGGSVALFFVIALEIMIMISPFAFFFYSVFNPVYKFIDQYALTRWLTGFFLPHMILPRTLFLKTVRISGSVFFIVGALTFIICALQVYMGKIFKWGVARAGLYKYIRHPQYLALALWGTGMAVLWPRFIVLASLSVMLILYYFLASDEEKRMLEQYGESYLSYMKITGMFLPRSIEKYFYLPRNLVPEYLVKFVAIPAAIIISVLGTGFMLRQITLNSLPFKSEYNITLISMLPEDDKLVRDTLDEIIRNRMEGQLAFVSDDKDYLGYLMPVDYIMQGMIANTDDDFHLYKQHHTVNMIADWVLHPFKHLRTPPSAMMAKMHHMDPSVARRHHCPIGINDPSLDHASCPYRRIILVEIDHNFRNHVAGKELMAFNAARVPSSLIDINTQTGEIINARELEKTTAWKDVPTPAI